MSSESHTGGERRATTRAELLTMQRATLAGLTNRRWAVRRLGPPIIASIALLAAGLTGDDGGPNPVRIAVFGAILAVWVWILRRHVTTSGRLEAERRDWSMRDRTEAARALPPGDLGPRLATIWDARDSADLEVVARNVGLGRLGALSGWRPIVSMVIGLMTAILASISVFDTLREPGEVTGRVMAIVASGIVAVSGIALSCTSGHEYWRRQLAWNRTALDRQAYLLRRRALGGPESAPEPELPRWARPLAAAVIVAAVVFVLARSAAANPVVLVVALAVLMVVALAVAVAVARAQRLHVEPMRSGGVDVLSSGPRFVRVDTTRDTIEIHDVSGEAASVTIPISDIRHVGSSPSVYPWVPGPVVLVTDDEPVILAGRRAGAIGAQVSALLADRRR
ncbi:hypothetical protein [Labedella endophytica]|uniref:Uncharacterized protein n=1 Tax=Labedella endophytica TaxID=1523160 RepID=A0A3S0X8F7_9MICO|nr:hypothetical protein [Labedella endophytica]RUQ98122.1 hypothetical protein ELQ94_13935 [Labedella endophytica]